MVDLPRLPRPVWLEIDEAALASNLAVFRELAGPGVELNAVVKADAYGHGLKSIGKLFEAAGADRLCVASVDEALALRAAGVRIPVLVLFDAPLGSLSMPEAEGVEITVSHRTAAAAIRQLAVRPADPPLAVHVEVETGLTRGGLLPEMVPAAIAALSGGFTRVAGLWTHIASPEDEAQTAHQIAEFERAVALVRQAGLPVPPRHIAATGGLLTGRVPAYEGVRIGLGLYGLRPLDLPIPADVQPFVDRLRPAMALKCEALRIEHFPAGTRVSYGGRWTAPRDSWIATLPVGYADAIPRPAPWGEALVTGRRVPLVGTVAMDAVMADVTDVIAEIGDREEFVLLGSQGDELITAADLARARNTIPWEVATGMSHRIPRVYHAASVLMGLRTLNAEIRVSTKGT